MPAPIADDMRIALPELTIVELDQWSDSSSSMVKLSGFCWADGIEEPAQ